MRRTYLGFSTVMLLGLVAFAWYARHSAARQHLQAEHVEKSLREQEHEIAALVEASSRTARDLSAASRQLEAVTALTHPAASDSERARNVEIKAWLQRIKKLRELFAQNPAQQIPEMRLLEEADWLRVTHSLEFDGEDERREALAKVRAMAKEKFTRDLASALTKFTTAHAGQLPAHLLELVDYLPPLADPAMLQRYELTIPASGAVNAADGKIDGTRLTKPSLAIQEKAAIDSDYDTRTYIYSNGGFGSTSGPEGWIDNFPDLRSRAIEAYGKANNGAVSLRLADLLPFMNPPLPSVTVEKLLAAEKKRNR